MTLFILPLSWSALRQLGEIAVGSISSWISSLVNMIALSVNADPPHNFHSFDHPDSPDRSASHTQQVTGTPTPNITPSRNMFAGPRSAGSASTSVLHERPKPPANKRPKLTLQTTSLPVTFGNSTTALSLSLSGSCSASPTVKNTFNNAYNGYQPLSSPIGGSCSSPSLYSSRSSLSESSYGSMATDDNIPYQLPLGLKSILRNSPIPSSLRPSLSAPASCISGGARRTYFPAKKQVRYRWPLDEEIKTVQFTAKHSDLSSSGETSSSPAMDSSDEDSDLLLHSGSEASDLDDDTETTNNATPTNGADRRPKTKRKNISGSERQIRAAALRDGLTDSGYSRDNNDNTPQTPVQRRRKRPRKWRWTLGPIENGHAQPIMAGSSSSPTAASGSLPGCRFNPLSETGGGRLSGSIPLLSNSSTQSRRREALDDLPEAACIPLPDSLRSSPNMSPLLPEA